ncbi:transcription intermediary factor 1-alpha isoform X2 [Paralichthys olivaceus]
METTGDNSVPNIETTIDSSVPNIETTGDTSVPNMETTGDTSVPNMETTGDNSVPNIETTIDSSVPNIETTGDTSVPNIETTGDSSVPNMETTEDNSVPNIETTTIDSSVPNIETTGDTSVPNMETTKDSSFPNMETTKNSSVPSMERTGDTSVPNMETTKDSSFPNMETTKNSSVPSMERTGDTSVPNMETTKDSSFTNLETTRDSCVPNLETTGDSSVPNMETTKNSSVPNMETTRDSFVPNLETTGDSCVPIMETRDSSVPNMETTGESLSQQCCGCDTSSSRCWCVDCGEALCDDCVSAHRRVTVTRSHRILNQPPGNVSTRPTKFCRLHPSEPLKLFCLTCVQYTCRDCQLIAHMNHRYLFVSDALNHTKKQLVNWSQPIRAQRDTANQSLKDMQTRLQHIKEGESQLEAELKKSHDICAQLLKRRMDKLMEEVKRELKSESDLIQKQMEKLNQLQKKQIFVTESADRAQNIQDLQSLFRCCKQVKYQLKDLQDQVLSPPETMTLLQVIVDRQSLETLLNFGKLEVEKIPFSISQISNHNPPPTSDCPKPSNMLQLLSPQLSLPPSSCPSLNQPTLPVTTSFAVTNPQHVRPLSSSTLESGSPLQRNPNQTMLLNYVLPVSSLIIMKPITSNFFKSTDQSSSCTVPKLVQPSLVSKSTNASDQNQPSSDLLTKPQIVQQVPCRPHSVSSVMPQFPLMLSQKKANTLPAETLPTNTLIRNMLPKQQNHLGLKRNSALLLGRKSLLAESRPVSSTGNSGSVGQGHKVLPKTDRSSAPLAQLTLMCDTHGKRYEIPFSSFVKHRQIPVVKAVADSACDHTVQQMSTRQEESPENKPTSTLSEETEPAESKPTSTLCEETEAAENNPTSTISEENKLVVKKPTFNKSTFTVSEEMEPAKNRPNFNKPTFIDSERTESTGKDRTAEGLSSLIGLQDFCLSQCQPRVSLFRLPLSLLRIAYPMLSSSLPAENKHISAKCEETEPAGKLSPTETTDTVEPSFETGQQDLRQPKVSLSRQPLTLLPTRRSLPGSLARIADDEVYVEELDEDCQSHISDISDDFGDFTEPLSSPESPVTLEIVYCSACGSDHSSIICSSCGRGYHRDCHIPPVGHDLWTEWNCSLCQDLSDPSDPYISERPKSPQRPCLSLLDQRRCESLLLHLKVEGCSRLSKVSRVWFRLMLMSERLTLHRPPAYQTPAEFICDVWSLFKQTMSSQDDLMNLRQSFRTKLRETFSSELRPTNREKLDSNQRHPESRATSESLLKKTRKRLREFLDLRGCPGPKRTKTDKVDV